MMKKIVFSLVGLFIFQATSQAQCPTGRYIEPIFDSVDIAKDVYFGTNIRVNKDTQDLHMDIYTPNGDTETDRPVLLMAHGGTFVAGSKADIDMVTFCKEMAKKGYVAISYDYRIGVGSVSAEEVVRAAYRALQDGKGAIRYIRENAEMLGVDPEQVIMGGTSAGALLSLHALYLDQGYELPAFLDTTKYHPDTNITGLDGLEGTTNAFAQSSRPDAVINLCGALLAKELIADYDVDVPVVSMHGTNDETVPYKRGFVESFGFQIVEVDGSFVVDSFAKTKGITSELYTFEGAGHVPYYDFDGDGDDTSAAYMDTTVTFVSQFLYDNVLKCNKTSTAVADDVERPTQFINPFPNPTNNVAIMELPGNGPFQIAVYDVAGKLIHKEISQSPIIRFEKSKLGVGTKIIAVHADDRVYVGKLQIE
jgi:para-nitrobenzyl esterase